MNFLEKLLAGAAVEWKTLGEVAKILRGRRLTRPQLLQENKYSVFHGGLEPLGFYSNFNRNADSVMIINVGASLLERLDIVLLIFGLLMVVIA